MGLFSGKSEHPLVNAKSARDLFDRLRGEDPLSAIDEIDGWLESIKDDGQIKSQRRLEILYQLEEIGIAAAHKLKLKYLAMVSDQRGQDFRLWQASQKYWFQIGSSYKAELDCLVSNKKLFDELRNAIPQMQARLLRAYGECLKWDQFRYGPIDTQLWLDAGHVYVQAEKWRWLDKKVDLGGGETTTVAAQYMRLLLFQAASMDRLQPAEIDVADRFLAHFVTKFSLTDKANPENVYWVDVDRPLPPTRLVKLPEITPTLRFFGTASALAAITTMRETVEKTQMLPREGGFQADVTIDAAICVLKHLEAFCSPKPPMRAHARHQVNSWMKVVDRFEFACAALNGDIVSSGSWAVEDVSRGGLRAKIEVAVKNGLGIGALVAMCPDGGDNWLIGVVRRIHRHKDARCSVGIETIGKTPHMVTFDGKGSAEGLLLESLNNVAGATFMAVSPGVWSDFRPVSFEYAGKGYRLRPLEEQQRGSDYVVGRYWVDALQG